ncbi:MAG TPA: hypothetical protein VGN85_02320 [Methyloceanibacter sp.]|nr:hypothetical protein [Methyloceanibacter sp.]
MFDPEPNRVPIHLPLGGDCTEDCTRPYDSATKRVGAGASRAMGRGQIQDRIVMPTSKECRQQAKACLQLARAASDFYVKIALSELASDLEEMAERQDRRPLVIDRY